MRQDEYIRLMVARPCYAVCWIATQRTVVVPASLEDLEVWSMRCIAGYRVEPAARVVDACTVAADAAWRLLASRVEIGPPVRRSTSRRSEALGPLVPEQKYIDEWRRCGARIGYWCPETRRFLWDRTEKSL